MSENQVVTGRPSIIVYETVSGVLCHCTPLNIATSRAIKARAELQFPYPDKKPYEVPMENAAPGVVEIAENNPEYQKLCKAIDERRTDWINRATLGYAVKFVKAHNGEIVYHTRETLIERYAPQVLELRKIAVLPEDDYEVIVYHIIFSGSQIRRVAGKPTIITDDLSNVLNAVAQVEPLTPAEIVQGVRFFRLDIPGQRDFSMVRAS